MILMMKTIINGDFHDNDNRYDDKDNNNHGLNNNDKDNLVVKIVIPMIFLIMVTMDLMV